MTITDVTNETPAVLECDEPYLVCGMCRHSEHCLLKHIKKAQSVPKLFDILYKIKIKFLMELKNFNKSKQKLS